MMFVFTGKVRRQSRCIRWDWRWNVRARAVPPAWRQPHNSEWKLSSITNLIEFLHIEQFSSITRKFNPKSNSSNSSNLPGRTQYLDPGLQSHRIQWSGTQWCWRWSLPGQRDRLLAWWHHRMFDSPQLGWRWSCWGSTRTAQSKAWVRGSMGREPEQGRGSGAL